MISKEISVIIPIFNSEKHLSACIESVLNQTFKDFELILVDDGSTDNSINILQSYAKKDMRIRLIQQENQGVSVARNQGLDNASGKYVMFIDSDDYIDTTFFESAYFYAESNHVDLYMSGVVEEFYYNNKIIHQVFYSARGEKTFSVKEMLDNLGDFYPLSYFHGPCCKLYRRECLERDKIRFRPDLNLMEDLLFNLDVFPYIEQIYISDEIYYHYRKDDDESLTTHMNLDFCEILTYVYGRLEEMIWNQSCPERVKLYFKECYCSMLLGGLTNYCFKHKKLSTSQDRQAFIEKIAKDPGIKTIKIREIKSWKQRMTLIALRLGMVGFLSKVLDIYFFFRLRQIRKKTINIYHQESNSIS